MLPKIICIFSSCTSATPEHRPESTLASRRRVNIPTGDLLDVIAGWPAEKQDNARKIIEEVEDEV